MNIKWVGGGLCGHVVIHDRRLLALREIEPNADIIRPTFLLLLFYPLKFDALLCPFFLFFFFDGIFSTVLWQSSRKPIDAEVRFQAKLPPKTKQNEIPPPAAPARRPICIRFVIF